MEAATHDRVCRAQALVTGGASGIGARHRRAARRARRARSPCSTSTPAACREPLRRPSGPTSPTTPRCAPPSPRRRSELGGLDILVNNAGIGAQGTVEDNADDEWHRVLDVNVLGMVRVARAALPHLRASAHAGDRQHLLDRGHRRPAAARALLRDARARSCR